MKILILLILNFLSSTYAATPKCDEKPLAQILFQGQPAKIELIGKDDPCDEFGGQLTHTPVSHIYFYVNYNIPGTVNLEDIDAAYQNSPLDLNVKMQLRNWKIVLVKQSWINKTYESDQEAVVPLSGNCIFISENILARGELISFLTKFYRTE